MNNSYYQQGPPQPQGYYPQGPPQPAYGGQQPMYYQQGPPPMAQQQYAQPQNEARPAKAKKERGCLTACLATLCCCFVCEEGCECCCDCCEDGCECCADMM